MKGFSLIETVVVIAIIAILASAGLVVSLDDYRRALFGSEVNLIEALIIDARASARNGTDGIAHGVELTEAGYTQFEGEHFDPDNLYNIFVPKNSSVTFSGLSEISFEAVSGRPLSFGEVNLTNGSRLVTITISNDGTISQQ